MAGADLESLRHLFADRRTWIALGTVTKTAWATDRSVLRCQVNVWPEMRQAVARMTREDVGPDSGDFSDPSPGDLAILAFPEGDDEQAYILKFLTSKEDRAPVRAVQGHRVIKAKSGRQVWITSDNKILISKGDGVPTENLVLGQQLKLLLVDLITELMDLSQKVAMHTHSGNLGYPTSPPNQSADFITLASSLDNLKSSPVEDEAILSDLAFTEKGG